MLCAVGQSAKIVVMIQRDLQPELMDDPKLPRDEHLRALTGLSRLNRYSGVAGVMYRHLRRLAAAQNRPLCVLDVASGSGDIPISWARRARRDRLDFQLTLMDISAVAVEEQQRLAKRQNVNVLSLQHDCLRTPLPSGFDVVTCSLFMHHLDEHQAFRLLQSMQSATDTALVICDLERSRLNLALVTMAARLLSRSSVVHTDAALSVRGAFTLDEFRALADNALARPVRVQRVFPCRFLATFDEQTVNEPVPAFA